MFYYGSLHITSPQYSPDFITILVYCLILLLHFEVFENND